MNTNLFAEFMPLYKEALAKADKQDIELGNFLFKWCFKYVEALYQDKKESLWFMYQGIDHRSVDCFDGSLLKILTLDNFSFKNFDLGLKDAPCGDWLILELICGNKNLDYQIKLDERWKENPEKILLIDLSIAMKKGEDKAFLSLREFDAVELFALLYKSFTQQITIALKLISQNKVVEQGDFVENLVLSFEEQYAEARTKKFAEVIDPVMREAYNLHISKEEGLPQADDENELDEQNEQASERVWDFASVVYLSALDEMRMLEYEEEEEVDVHADEKHKLDVYEFLYPEDKGEKFFVKTTLYKEYIRPYLDLIDFDILVNPSVLESDIPLDPSFILALSASSFSMDYSMSLSEQWLDNPQERLSVEFKLGVRSKEMGSIVKSGREIIYTVFFRAAEIMLKERISLMNMLYQNGDNFDPNSENYILKTGVVKLNESEDKDIKEEGRKRLLEFKKRVERLKEEASLYLM